MWDVRCGIWDMGCGSLFTSLFTWLLLASSHLCFFFFVLIISMVCVYWAYLFYLLFGIWYLEWEKRGGKEVSFDIVGFPVKCMNNVNKVKPIHKLSCKASFSSLFQSLSLPRCSSECSILVSSSFTAQKLFSNISISLN